MIKQAVIQYNTIVNDKKTLGLVGLGVIAGNYYTGLTTSQKFNLVGVCDIDANAPSREMYKEYSFFDDYEKMVGLDYVAITTNTASHYQVARHFLEKGTNVILEKPGTLYMHQLEELVAIAKGKGLYFDVVFHWQHGSEIEFLEKNLHKFGSIQKIHSEVLDPYTDTPNRISDSKKHLKGCWLDSGVNQLSMISKFINLNGAKLVSKKHTLDKVQNQPSQSDVRFESKCDVDITLHLNWNTQTNNKSSQFITDKGTLDILHSQQAVLFDGEQVFLDDSMPRLQRHYYNYFTKFTKVDSTGDILNVHKLLFDGE